MSPLAWTFLGVICLLWLAPVPFYVQSLRQTDGNLNRRTQVFVAVRIWELVLFVVILVASILTTRWFLVAEIIPLGVLPLYRRLLKRRELASV